MNSTILINIVFFNSFVKLKKENNKYTLKKLMRTIKLNKNKGIVFWITGLSGSGKTTIAEKIEGHISKKYGPTIIVSGDDLRKMFNFKKFSRNDRLTYALIYSKFCKCITDSRINIILSTVSLFHKVRKWNRSNVNNYIEIYIQSDINNIIKQKNKFFYKKNYKNIIGKDIKPEFPQSPHIIIENNFNIPVKVLTEVLIKKINKFIKL